MSGVASAGWLRLDARDNVLVCGDEAGIAAGAAVAPGVVAAERIPGGHKVAAVAIPRGAVVRKYAQPIGVATADIRAGDHVHVHNIAMPPRELLDAEYGGPASGLGAAVAGERRTFLGYPRAEGRAGTRNYVCVVATVNCSASVVKAVCRAFPSAELAERGIDGVVPITHGQGCAQAIGGEGYQLLNRTLAGWIRHPNVVGAVVVGLGCEGTTFESMLAAGAGAERLVVRKVGIQDAGGTSAAIAAATRAVREVLDALPRFARVPLPASELALALNCGGSDGLSGLTANPALGVASDALVAQGGCVALAEIPECHGAEGLLAARAAGDDVRRKLAEVFDWWHRYSARHGVTLNDNLAPGNIAGGISTIVEKSLGAVTKAGTSPLQDVLGYAEPFRTAGFVLVNTPGFDPVSVTGLVASGANLVAFTTGRGSVYGCAIAPTLKIATNTSLFRRMPDDMDLDAGAAVHEGVAAVGARVFERLLAVASGEATCSERLGLGGEEFVPWAIGETL